MPRPILATIHAEALRQNLARMRRAARKPGIIVDVTEPNQGRVLIWAE